MTQRICHFSYHPASIGFGVIALFVPILMFLAICTVGIAVETTTPEPVLKDGQPPFCYRLEEHLDEAILSESTPSETTRPTTYTVWPPPAPLKSPLECDNGKTEVIKNVLRFTATDGGYVILPEDLSIYTPTVASIALQLSITGVSKLRLGWRHRSFPWAKEVMETNTCFVELPVKADGVIHTYNVQMGDIDSFQSNRIVDGFMLSCDEASEIEISRVEVRTRSELFSEATTGTREYAINGEIRQVLFMHSPTQAVFQLRLPEHPVFTSGLASVADDNPTSFSLAVIHDGNRQVLLNEDGLGTQHWQDFRVDLAAFADTDVKLELLVQSASPGQIALWGTPCIYNSTTGARAFPNILVYLVDALRADHLESYGYDHVTSPNLSLLVAEGALFQNCFSQETCTKPSMMTMYSGIDSQAHGYTFNSGILYGSEFPFFSTALRRFGYATAAISQNSYSPPSSKDQHAFDRLVELFDINKNVTADTFDAATSFLEQHRDRPFYLHIHTMECHELWTPRPDTCPYTPPPPYDQVYKDPENAFPPDRYDGSILYADYNFKRIRDKLEELGLLRDTLIVFTSDHGYALGERGEWAHGKDPYLDQIHVPLIMAWPGGAIDKTIITDHVQLVDLYPTFLDILGLPAPEICQGISLLPLLRGNNTGFQNRPIFSSKIWGDYNSVIRGNWKLMQNNDKGKDSLLYSMDAAFPEAVNLLPEHPDIAEELHQVLKAHIKKNKRIYDAVTQSIEKDKETQVDPVKLEILKSLGYISE